MVRVIGRGIHAGELRGEKPLKVTYAVVDENTVAFSLEDQRKISAPIDWYPRLCHATPAERNNWKLISSGRAVFWPSLKIAISAVSVIKGEKATESPTELRRWLEQRKRHTA
jgi:hypothetical protein